MPTKSLIGPCLYSLLWQCRQILIPTCMPWVVGLVLKEEVRDYLGNWRNACMSGGCFNNNNVALGYTNIIIVIAIKHWYSAPAQCARKSGERRYFAFPPHCTAGLLKRILCLIDWTDKPMEDMPMVSQKCSEKQSAVSLVDAHLFACGTATEQKHCILSFLNHRI